MDITIGMGATFCIGSDSYPATVIDITPSGKTVTIQEDNYEIISGSSHDGSAEYTYSANPNGRVISFRYSTKSKNWKNSSYRAYFGIRRKYYDPHF